MHAHSIWSCLFGEIRSSFTRPCIYLALLCVVGDDNMCVVNVSVRVPILKITQCVSSCPATCHLSEALSYLIFQLAFLALLERLHKLLS